MAYMQDNFNIIGIDITSKANKAVTHYVSDQAAPMLAVSVVVRFPEPAADEPP